MSLAKLEKGYIPGMLSHSTLGPWFACIVYWRCCNEHIIMEMFPEGDRCNILTRVVYLVLYVQILIKYNKAYHAYHYVKTHPYTMNNNDSYLLFDDDIEVIVIKITFSLRLQHDQSFDICVNVVSYPCRPYIVCWYGYAQSHSLYLHTNYGKLSPSQSHI